jgi:hypothetical protein
MLISSLWPPVRRRAMHRSAYGNRLAMGSGSRVFSLYEGI